MTGQVGTMPPWLMEASIAPFALASIPITIWCVRHWPAKPPEPAPEPAEPDGAPASP
jgi:hypothetical protein